MNEILIYAGPRSDYQIPLSFFQSLFSSDKKYEVLAADANEIANKISTKNVAAIVVPGSYNFDDEYLQALLEIKGLITEYVSSGGTYIGLCAGGFLAFSQMEYPVHIQGTEPLLNEGFGLISGRAVGSFQNSNVWLNSAINAVPVSLKFGKKTAQCVSWYMGGPLFFADNGQHLENWALLTMVKLPNSNEEAREYPGVICKRWPDGGSVLVSSIHFEYTPKSAMKKIRAISVANRSEKTNDMMDSKMFEEAQKYASAWTIENWNFARKLRTHIINENSKN